LLNYRFWAELVVVSLLFYFCFSLVWFISSSPEGESELVSGFNIDYGAGGFGLIFVAEYARILFMRLLFCVIFGGCDLHSLFFYVRFFFIPCLFCVSLLFNMSIKMSSYLGTSITFQAKMYKKYYSYGPRETLQGIQNLMQ
jgi:NADH:ubiquinone oxidoreductase subunit H